ncbi:MAG: lipoyltransferase [Bacteroidales bacterium]|nr:lipoyltransferase [Bacteroidales bacterium]
MFYLAMEEYVAAHRELGEAMFFWKVEPTVIFGRNQVMGAEVNVDWCREHGVRMYRRKSGGGCVYSDLGNLMISYVSSETEGGRVFGGYLEMLAGALRGLGVNAEVSGRNDVLIDGRKVSGNAFQLLGDRSIVHGTLLYDTDFAALTQAITPSQSKVRSKGVSSVRQRVTNLKPCLENSCPVRDIDSLADYLAKQLCGSSVVLDEAAVAEISEIEKTYLDPAFIAGHEANGSIEKGAYIPGVGHVSLQLALTDGKISRVHLDGDYFALKTPEEIDNLLTVCLSGLKPDRESVCTVMTDSLFQDLIPGLNAVEFADLFKL